MSAKRFTAAVPFFILAGLGITITAFSQIPGQPQLTQERVFADAYIAVETMKVQAEQIVSLLKYIGELTAERDALKAEVEKLRPAVPAKAAPAAAPASKGN